MTTTTIEDASENDKARATPGTARATKTGGSTAIRQLFREAVKALLRRAADEPKPEARRRSGETGKGFVKVVPDPKQQHEPGNAAARGCYARLGEPQREQGKRAGIKTGKAFGKAARDATEPDDWMPDDFYEMDAFNPASPLFWHGDTYDDDGPDDDFGCPVTDFPAPRL